jgi:arylformamidase
LNSSVKKLIDLTHLLNENISVYPGTIGPKFESIAKVETHGYAELKATMVLHAGTHIDAPCHIVQHSKSLDQFGLEKFMGKAMVISCLGKNEISLAYLKSFEQKIKTVNFILFYTGWQNKWKTNAYFENCPTLTTDAAKWLTQFKNVHGIGFDAFSVDSIISADVVTEENMPNHHILLGADILLIENLTNLDKLPEEFFSFQCLPLKVEGADGSPVRAIAIVQ